MIDHPIPNIEDEDLNVDEFDDGEYKEYLYLVFK